LVNTDEIEGILLACQPSNAACLRAARKMGTVFYSASHLRPYIPSQNSFFYFHLHHQKVRNWNEDPLFGLVQQKAVQDGAWRLLEADNRLNGLAWQRGSRVFLDGEWYLSERHREFSRGRLLEIADGLKPRVKLWVDPPPLPGIDRCA
jgi:hypothetical protein